LATLAPRVGFDHDRTDGECSFEAHTAARDRPALDTLSRHRSMRAAAVSLRTPNLDVDRIARRARAAVGRLRPARRVPPLVVLLIGHGLAWSLRGLRAG